jgi:primary-amine oxidase
VTRHGNASCSQTDLCTGRGGDGIKTWAARNDNVVDDDIVVWVQFGMNHVPRIEDFPVM